MLIADATNHNNCMILSYRHTSATLIKVRDGLANVDDEDGDNDGNDYDDDDNDDHDDDDEDDADEDDDDDDADDGDEDDADDDEYGVTFGASQCAVQF